MDSKKTEAVGDCSDIDDIICFFATGKLMISKVAEKKFVGKDLIYTSVWKKGDTRTIYHLFYQDGVGGSTMMNVFMSVELQQIRNTILQKVQKVLRCFISLSIQMVREKLFRFFCALVRI
jgi:hypothetical protein